MAELSGSVACFWKSIDYSWRPHLEYSICVIVNPTAKKESRSSPCKYVDKKILTIEG